MGLNKGYIIWKDEAKPKWWPVDVVYRDTTKLRRHESIKALQALQRCKLKYPCTNFAFQSISFKILLLSFHIDKKEEERKQTAPRLEFRADLTWSLISETTIEPQSD